MSKVPDEIRLCPEGECLIVCYKTQEFLLSAEFLRVCSPSAEVRGHGGDWKILAGKNKVRIQDVRPVGSYAVRLIFSDRHDSGIYSWDILWDLCQNQKHYWQMYLEGLAREGKSRDLEETVRLYRARLEGSSLGERDLD